MFHRFSKISQHVPSVFFGAENPTCDVLKGWLRFLGATRTHAPGLCNSGGTLLRWVPASTPTELLNVDPVAATAVVTDRFCRCGHVKPATLSGLELALPVAARHMLPGVQLGVIVQVRVLGQALEVRLH